MLDIERLCNGTGPAWKRLEAESSWAFSLASLLTKHHSSALDLNMTGKRLCIGAEG